MCFIKLFLKYIPRGGIFLEKCCSIIMPTVYEIRDHFCVGSSCDEIRTEIILKDCHSVLACTIDAVLDPGTG